MSMTRRTDVLGFGSLNLVSNFLYDDKADDFEPDMSENSSVFETLMIVLIIVYTKYIHTHIYISESDSNK